MIRKVIRIDEERCNGCGLCASACHEGAIEIVGGKATLTRDDYCDGFGDCLPACPQDAISFEEREAAAYDQAAVDAHLKERAAQGRPAPARPNHSQSGCPSASPVTIAAAADTAPFSITPVTRLKQWPCQLRLVRSNAAFFQGADLLVAADCTAYAYAGMHEEFMKDRVTVIGCTKFDDEDYIRKLTEIIENNDIHSVTVVRMEVPCCGGMEYAAKTALSESGKKLPFRCVTLSVDGQILEDEKN